MTKTIRSLFEHFDENDKRNVRYIFVIGVLIGLIFGCLIGLLTITLENTFKSQAEDKTTEEPQTIYNTQWVEFEFKSLKQSIAYSMTVHGYPSVTEQDIKLIEDELDGAFYVKIDNGLTYDIPYILYAQGDPTVPDAKTREMLADTSYTIEDACRIIHAMAESQ